MTVCKHSWSDPKSLSAVCVLCGEYRMNKFEQELNAALAREAALRGELEVAKNACSILNNLASTIGTEKNALQRRLTVAERDACRYRYLREGAVMHYMSAEGSESKDAYLTITGYGHDDSVASIDNAIDAQMLAALKPAAEGEGS